MPKPKSDDPRCVSVTTRLTEGEAKLLDGNRGGLSRSDYIRSKILKRRR